MPTINGLNLLRGIPVLVGVVTFACLAVSNSPAAEPSKAADGGTNTQLPAQGSIKGEVLVKFIEGVARSRAAGGGRRFVTEKVFATLSARRDQIFLLGTSDAFSTDELLEIYRSDPRVASVSPNYARTLHRLPDDPFFDQLWGLRNIGQSIQGINGYPGADIDAARAWNVSTGNTEVVVAVIDSGVYYDHEDLFPNMWQNPDEVPGNGIDDDENGYIDDVYGYDFAADNSGNNDSDPMDIGTHGSHVTGTAAAFGNNGIGITGVAWNAKIMALKGMRPDGYLYDSDLIEAMEYAIAMKARGVNVVAINASYGSTEGNQSDLACEVIAEAGQAGIVFVASAGNDRADNDRFPHYPASCDAPNIISVAAGSQFDDLAAFSNYGFNSVDLAAPGQHIFSTAPKVAISVSSGGTNYAAAAFEYAGFTSGITGTVYDCGKGYPAQFPAGVAGNIALIERGSDDAKSFFFSDKVQNAMDAGAAAVIIYNNVPGLTMVTLGRAGNWVPAVFISQADGRYLASLDTPMATVVHDVVSGYLYFDGTSMAAPHVSGAVALLAAAFPRESVYDRINRILGGVEPLQTLSGKVATGGRLNLYNSLHLFRFLTIAPIYDLLLFE